MSEQTKIQWTNKTWNPWRGCTKIHTRCKNCYMFAEQKRYGNDPSIVMRTKTWGDPIKWQKQAALEGRTELVFTCSWSDWFHQDADDWRQEAWAVIRACPNLIFQVLTKRPERIKNHLPPDWGNGYPNVWLGSSLDPSDKHGTELFGVHAKTKFLSLEPLVASVDPGKHAYSLDWVIVGGESGHNARPCNIAWVRSIVAQCKAANVACFVKQLGANVICRNDNGFDGESKTEFPMGVTTQDLDPMEYQGAPVKVCLRDKKGGDMNEWPEDLRVRQFPSF